MMFEENPVLGDLWEAKVRTIGTERSFFCGRFCGRMTLGGWFQTCMVCLQDWHRRRNKLRRDLQVLWHKHGYRW